MKKIIRVFFCIALAAGFSCGGQKTETPATSTEPYSEIKKAHWLAGTWKGSSPDGTTIESWEIVNDSLMVGASCFLAGKDTVTSETIRMEQNTNGLFYVPVVKNQNNGEAVRFALTSSGNSEMVFANPAHDFPQKIIYKQITNDSLVAEISGKLNEKNSTITFTMRRVNQ